MKNQDISGQRNFDEEIAVLAEQKAIFCSIVELSEKVRDERDFLSLVTNTLLSK